MGKGFSLEDFKSMVSNNDDFKNEIIGKKDIIDLDSGVMRIHKEHLNKYLEKYCCKNAEDLQDTLYYYYGIYCQILDA